MLMQVNAVPMLFLGIILTSLSALKGQQAPDADHSAHAQQLQVAVDGKTTPELIPDDLAYNHFLISISERSSVPVEQARRQKVKLNRIGFSAQDYEAFLAAVAGLRGELDEIDSIHISTGDSPGLRSRWESTMSAARMRVHSGITQAGAAQLNAFIRTHVKRCIVVYSLTP